MGWELWYPYQYHNKKSELVGIDINAFNAIMRGAKLNYHIAEIPWKTHLHLIKIGKVDIAMGASKTKEREQYAFFTKPYRTETVNLVVKKGDISRIKLTKLADLIGSPYFIGVESGYFYGDAYASLISNPKFSANISEAIDLEENVSMLIDGHLDGLLVDPNTMLTFVKKYQLENQFEIHPLEIYSANIHIMLSKKTMSPAIVEKINASIDSLTNELTLLNSRKPTL